MTGTLPTVKEIAETIDHALLKPQFTMLEVAEGLELAKQHDVFSVCVRPADVIFATGFLKGSDVKVGTVIGFPNGAIATAVKVFETQTAITDGAVEVDMVLNIGWLKSGLFAEVKDDIKRVVAAAQEAGIEKVKVIFETAYLTPEEIVTACKLSEEAGADFVKTSTGFAHEGATLANVKLMRASVSDSIEVKASGGVTNLDTLLEMRAAGVTRFGTSAAATILTDLKTRLETGEASTATHEGNY